MTIECLLQLDYRPRKRIEVAVLIKFAGKCVELSLLSRIPYKASDSIRYFCRSVNTGYFERLLLNVFPTIVRVTKVELVSLVDFNINFKFSI